MQNVFRLFVLIAVMVVGTMVQAQQPKQVFRIGVLLSGSTLTNNSRIAALRQGLWELGYVEGKNIIVDYRFAEGKIDRFPVLAAELVQLKPDVLVTSGAPGVRALMNATSTIPIVMAAIGDAVGAGFVNGLAQPGGNVTGFSFLNTDLSTKRLELLKEALPQISRVAVLTHPSSGKLSVEATLSVAGLLKVRIQVFEVTGPDDFDRALLSAKKGGARAINVLASPILFFQRQVLVDLATKHRLPGMYEAKEFVDAGGLLSYGANLDDLFRRAAVHVDKILKGTKPADIPVEQPMKFEFVVNLKTAKQIGVTIEPNVLVRANRVIR